MYPILEQMLVEKKITKVAIAKFLKLRYATVIDKFSGKSRLFYDEAKKIKDEFFPDFEMEFLFSTPDDNGENHIKVS